MRLRKGARVVEAPLHPCVTVMPETGNGHDNLREPDSLLVSGVGLKVPRTNRGGHRRSASP
jgi:hypothetical protein